MIQHATWYKTMLMLSALFMLALGPSTQVCSATPQHQHSETVIDGSKNPELIPDSTALRMWLVTVSVLPNATSEERDRQRGHLAVLQLNELDTLQLTTILTEFKSQYAGLIERYNESTKAALAHGTEPAIKLFLQQRDDLVQITKAAIALRLSPQGASRIESHVQEHKKHIQLHSQTHTMTVGGGQ